MADEQTGPPDGTAVRVALWRAMHVLLDPPPHVLEDEIGLRLTAPDDGWRRRPDMDPRATSGYRAAIVARARFIEDLVVEQAGRSDRRPSPVKRRGSTGGQYLTLFVQQPRILGRRTRWRLSSAVFTSGRRCVTRLRAERVRCVPRVRRLLRPPDALVTRLRKLRSGA